MANITKEDILRLLGEETAKVSDLKAFIKIVTDIVKQSKEGFDSISKENLAKLKESLDYFNNESTKMLADLDDKTSVAYVAYEKKLADTKKEVVKIIEEAKKIQLKPAEPGKPGEPGKDADEDSIVNRIIEKIPNIIKDTVKLPETKDYVVDTGLEIVTKINALPHDSPEDDEYKIDWVHIKGWPKRWGEDFIYPLQINTGGGAGTTFITAGDNVTITGIGTVGDPYVINANAEGTVFIEAGDNITIDGTGTELDPYIINAVGDGTGTVTNIVTSGSIAGGPITTTGTLSLVNDNATPGNNFYYGTNGAGTKGYFSLAPYMTNIYNSDGQITDPVRTLDANGNDLFFTNIRVFDITVGGEVGEGFQVHAGLVDFNVNYNADVNFSTAGGAGSLNMDSLGGTMILSPSGQNLVIGNSNLTGQSGLVISNMPGLTPVTSDFGFLGFNTTTGEVVSVDAGSIPVDIVAGDNISITGGNTINAIPTAPDRAVQWNNNGAFGGTIDFIYDTNGNLLIGGIDVIGTGSFGFGTGTAVGGGTIHVGNGSIGFGTANTFGDIDATDEASMAFGLANTGGIINSGQASLAFGQSEGTDSQISGNGNDLTFGIAVSGGLLIGFSNGSITAGSVATTGSISARADGSIAMGSASNGSGTAGGDGIFTAGAGAIAMGSSDGSDADASPAVVTYSLIQSIADGSKAFGQVLAGGQIRSAGTGSYVSGVSNGFFDRGEGAVSDSMLEASGSGTHAFGNVSNGALITAGGDGGGIAAGRADGYVVTASENEFRSTIENTADGSIAIGRVSIGGLITTEVDGSIIFGQASGNDDASLQSQLHIQGNAGTLLFGRASAGARIVSNGDGASMVFGLAENSDGDGNPSSITDGGFAGATFGSVTGGAAIHNMAQSALVFGVARGNDGSGIASRILSDVSGADTPEGSIAHGVVEDGGFIHNAVTNVSGDIRGRGSVAFGWAQGASGDGVVSTIETQSTGSMAFGVARDQGYIGTLSNGPGSLAFGYVENANSEISTSGGGSVGGALAFGKATDGGKITAVTGSFAFGNSENTSSLIETIGNGALAGGQVTEAGYILASDGGAMAFGYATSEGVIQAIAQGSFALGWAFGADSTITASGIGSMAMGHADGGLSVIASGQGAFAGGNTQGLGDIIASGSGSFAFGLPNNSRVEAAGDGSFAFGDGVLVEGYGSVAMGQQIQIQTNASSSFAFGNDNLIADGAGVTNAYAFGQGIRIDPGVGMLDMVMAFGHSIEISASQVYAIGDTYSVANDNTFNVGFGDLDFQIQHDLVYVRYLATGGATEVVTVNASGGFSSSPAGMVVDSADLTAQTTGATVATTNPGADGTFRVGGYINTTTITGSTVQMTVQYTDENGNVITRTLPMTNSAGATSVSVATILDNFCAAEFQFRVQGGSTITVSTSITGTPVYDVGATIEQLR